MQSIVGYRGIPTVFSRADSEVDTFLRQHNLSVYSPEQKPVQFSRVLGEIALTFSWLLNAKIFVEADYHLLFDDNQVPLGEQDPIPVEDCIKLKFTGLHIGGFLDEATDEMYNRLAISSTSPLILNDQPIQDYRIITPIRDISFLQYEFDPVMN